MTEEGCPAHMQLLEFCQSGNIHCISSEWSKKHVVRSNQSRSPGQSQFCKQGHMSFHFNIFGEDIKFKTRCREQTYPKFMRLHLTSSYQLIPTMKYVFSQKRENMFFYNFSVSPEVQMDHGSGSNNI